MQVYNYNTASHWDKVLCKEFEAESDRAAVILVASLFENALTSALKSRFVPNPNSSDPLFDGTNSSLSAFSDKIDMCYRVGLISSKFCRDLHLIRKIRNEFAHNIYGCSFENGEVKQRILELAKSSKIIEKFPQIRKCFGDGTRGDFLMIVSWMFWSLNNGIEMIDNIKEATEEFGYIEPSKDRANNLKKSPENLERQKNV